MHTHERGRTQAYMPMNVFTVFSLGIASQMASFTGIASQMASFTGKRPELLTKTNTRTHVCTRERAHNM